jgi:hypothetical protein
MIDAILKHLNEFDLDVRKSHDARFVDHKCTPDIVCFMADCVLNMVATKPKFVINDIWETQYFINNSRVIFNKPWANNENAYNEYNKVLSQPLKLLAYAHVLKVETIKRTLVFEVQNQEMLDFISSKDRNSYIFLLHYFNKVLKDSGFMKYMEYYKNNCNLNLNEERNFLYERYYRLISGNTPSQSKLDVRRMFHKVLNVYAVDMNIPGSKGKFAMNFSDLMYNRKNWRDLYKDKSITRQEAESIANDDEQDEAYTSYYIQKAINTIRKIHFESEVHDQWANGEATQVHHIFPKSAYPELAAFIENLILLTPTQHNTKAHPNNNTQQINKDYQLTCLLAKSDSIENSLLAYGEKFYRKESFVYVINKGLARNLDVAYTFKELKRLLIDIYNQVA